MKSTVVFLSSCFLLLGGCTKHVSIKAQFNGAEVHSCGKAEISKLSPENGGFRFTCTGQSSVYVIYDTSVNKDGSVASVDLTSAGSSQSYLPAVFSSKRGTEDCASAKALNRETGEAPLRTGMSGNPENGTYEWAMAKPCGTLVLTIADAVN